MVSLEALVALEFEYQLPLNEHNFQCYLVYQ